MLRVASASASASASARPLAARVLSSLSSPLLDCTASRCLPIGRCLLALAASGLHRRVLVLPTPATTCCTPSRSRVSASFVFPQLGRPTIVGCKKSERLDKLVDEIQKEQEEEKPRNEREEEEEQQQQKREPPSFLSSSTSSPSTSSPARSLSSASLRSRALWSASCLPVPHRQAKKERRRSERLQSLLTPWSSSNSSDSCNDASATISDKTSDTEQAAAQMDCPSVDYAHLPPAELVRLLHARDATIRKLSGRLGSQESSDAPALNSMEVDEADQYSSAIDMSASARIEDAPSKESTPSGTTISAAIASTLPTSSASTRSESTHLASSARDERTKKKKRDKEFDFNRYGHRHIALRLAYFGWSYRGFAIQDDHEETIEAHLLRAFQKVKLIVDFNSASYSRCGRTDRGVSAFGQVVALKVRSNFISGEGIIPPASPDVKSHYSENEIDYVLILNNLLPPDIRVLSWCPVSSDFSARFDCKYRKYKYFFSGVGMDIEKMKDAAARYVGEHDFRNFCKIDPARGPNQQYARRIMESYIEPVPIASGDTNVTSQLYAFNLMGSAFLWHQVRCMVAILFFVGQGYEDPSVVDDLMDIKKTPGRPSYSMAPEHPLVLYDCGFGDKLDGLSVTESTHQKYMEVFQRNLMEEGIKFTMMETMFDVVRNTRMQVKKDGQAPITASWNEISTTRYQEPRAIKHVKLALRDKGDTVEQRFEDYRLKKGWDHLKFNDHSKAKSSGAPTDSAAASTGTLAESSIAPNKHKRARIEDEDDG